MAGLASLVAQRLAPTVHHVPQRVPLVPVCRLLVLRQHLLVHLLFQPHHLKILPSPYFSYCTSRMYSALPSLYFSYCTCHMYSMYFSHCTAHLLRHYLFQPHPLKTEPHCSPLVTLYFSPSFSTIPSLYFSSNVVLRCPAVLSCAVVLFSSTEYCVTLYFFSSALC